MHYLFCSRSTFWITLMTSNLVPLAEALTAVFYFDTDREGFQFTVNNPHYAYCYFNNQMSGISSFSFQGESYMNVPYAVTIYQGDYCTGPAYTYHGYSSKFFNYVVNELAVGFNDLVNSVRFDAFNLPPEGFSNNTGYSGLPWDSITTIVNVEQSSLLTR